MNPGVKIARILTEERLKILDIALKRKELKTVRI